ncbi:MAG: phosphate butyryltransferase [Muribaculaceae bacterium]|nr:phosphate butyryltransferase [Muribaculaceae bacterium]
MKPLRTFEDMLELFRAKATSKRVVIISPNDEHTEFVVKRCADEELINLTLVFDGGESDELKQFCRNSKNGKITTLSCADTAAAAAMGVKIVHDGEADVLMKGSLSTDVLLHAVIDKEGGNGLIEKGKTMSHIAVTESKVYDKLLMVSDVAVIPNPTLEQYDSMIRYDCDVCRSLGISSPKIALIHFSEKSNPRFPICQIYDELKQRAAANAYGDMSLDGPMDVKSACDKESAQIKHISSPVTGNADVVIMPDLEAGNTFYKTISFFGKARMAGLVTGTCAPVVVASRADSAESKFFSLILACIAANK